MDSPCVATSGESRSRLAGVGESPFTDLHHDSNLSELEILISCCRVCVGYE